MHTRFYWGQLSDFPEEQRQYIYPPVLHEEPVFWHLNHLSNFCILTDISYLIVILISISLFSCEWESIFICMLAFQEFLPCIISSCLRESVFSLLYTNQTILFPLLWRVTYLYYVSKSHTKWDLFLSSLFCSTFVLFIPLYSSPYCLYYNGLFLHLNIMCSNPLPAPVFPLLFQNWLRSSWPLFFLFIPNDDLLAYCPNTIYWKR